jgi:hypothetical protein
LTEFNVTAADRAIDELIERRTTERERANREASAWAESAERYDLRRAAQLRQEWCEWHRRQVALFEALAAEHRQKLLRLIDSGGA